MWNGCEISDIGLYIMKKQIVLSALFLIGLGSLHGQSIYFADGYHGGVFGHYPEWQTEFMMNKLREYPGWRINLEIEPETFDSVKVRAPETYRKFQWFLAEEDGKTVEFTNPTYSQPYCYNISGESLIRQFSYGINRLKKHFPSLLFNTYSVEEPCFTSALPQILHLFGFRYGVLKNPDTCYGGYMAAYGGELVNWIGPDGTELLTVPRYEAEKLEDNSTWQTTAWNNSPAYLNACKAAGIKNPVGMCYQDAGWKGGPWIGAPDKTNSIYTLWTPYLDHIADRQESKDWKLTQEDVQVSLMWGSQVLQKLAQEIRVTEQKLVQAEKVVSMQKICQRKGWSQAKFEEAWRCLLMSQHHDCWIVPYNNMGSTGKTWAENVRLYTTRSNRLCDELMANQTESDSCLLVYNTTGIVRKEWVSCELAKHWASTPFILKDVAGRKVPYQKNADGTIVFQAHVPPMGYTTYTLEEGKAKAAKGLHTRQLTNGNVLVESDLYKIEINPRKGGTLASLYSKKERKEWFDPTSEYCFNELRGHFYEEGGFLSSTSQPAKVTVENDGPFVITVRVEGKIGTHPFLQYLTLAQGEARVDCRLVINWQGNPRIGEYKENSEMQDVRKAYYDDRYKLHILFPVALADQQVYKNAPFDVCKSDLRNTFFNRWDSIKNNVILNWADLYGKRDNNAMALFTDHTTSYLHGEDYPLGLTIQYAGTGLWHRDYVIQEKTDIQYSLLPHKGLWNEANLTYENNRRNEPLIVQFAAMPEDDRSLSILNTPDKGMEVSALYYEGEDLLIRLYNEGTGGDKSLELRIAPCVIEEINLNNEKIADCSYVQSGRKSLIRFNMPQFGIKTFRIKQ